MDKKRQKATRTAIVVLLLLALGYLGYSRWMAPTDIALVNMSGFQGTPIARSNTNKAVRYHLISPQEFIKNSRGYEFVLLNGMGLKIDADERAKIQKYAESGKPIMTVMATNPQNNICNIDSLRVGRIEEYFYNGNKQNNISLANYIRKYIDGKKTSVPDPLDPVSTPYNVLYHLDESVQAPTVKEYEDYLRQIGYYYEGAPKVALVGALNSPYSGNKKNLDELIQALSDKRLNVYPIYASNKELLDFLSEIRPSAIIHQAHGRMFPGPLSEVAVRSFKQFDCPVFTPLTILSDRKTWLDDPMGMFGGFMSQSIVMPELDGGVVPFALNFEEINSDGIAETVTDPDRLARFADIVARTIQLREKPNSEKRLAIFYLKGPGQQGLAAQGLETIPALYNVLKELKAAGYAVDLPADADELKAKIMRDGPVLEHFTKGAIDTYMRESNAIHFPTSQLDSLMQARLAPASYADVVDKYGPAPGSYMSGRESDGSTYVAVAGVRLGNVILLPQPMPALGDDTFAIVHGANTAPPYPYIAAYLWAEEVFRADAIMHFGTHGSLEFTPQKQVALSSQDWPDALVGTTPHFYYYTIANVGESMMAKRRSYATLVSYLTPPFEESDTRSTFDRLMQYITNYQKAPSDKAAQAVQKEAVRLGIHRSLKLDSLSSQPYGAEEIERIEHFAEEIANEKIYTTLYTTGVPYSEAKLQNTIVALACDPIAYGRAALDKINGKEIPEGRAFTRQYLEPAKALVRRILGGFTPDSSFVASYGGFSLEVYRQAGRQADESTDSLRFRSDAIISLGQAIMRVPSYYAALKSSPDRELAQLLRAFGGGYISPSSGGDPVANPSALPTGRNLYSINPETTPTEVAWEKGKMLAKQTLDDYLKKHGDYPEKVSFSFWSSEFIETGGATIAQVLYLLGVEPVRDPRGRVSDVRLIPSAELGRPRVDVLVQTSGQFRDLAASRLDLITKAVWLASQAGDGETYANHVHEGNVRIEQRLVEAGMAPATAREWAGNRVFGGINGMYGTGIQEMMFASDRWDDRSEIADVYLHNMGAAYGTTEQWGAFHEGMFRAAVEHTDVVVHPRQSNTWGALSLDHVFEFMGGLNLTIKSVTGKEPEAYFADYRNHSHARIQELKEAVGVESHSTILNPSFVKKVVDGGGSGNAMRIASIVENAFGWEVSKPDLIDDELWSGIYDIWVNDVLNVGATDYIEQNSPASLEQITGVMLESIRKGMWAATPEQTRHLAELNAHLVTTYGLSGGGMTSANASLRDFIRTQLPDDQQKKDFDRAVKTTLTTPQKSAADDTKSVVLSEEKRQNNRVATGTTEAMQSDTLRTLMWIGIGIVVLLALTILILRRKHS